ncbi:acyltransferase [Microbispora sp. GKU 823]|uniref:acyltransferase family protein n=1 Tax=Microbispora sp. GKU 823 TaxID=1652100 RepID=UPI0009A3AAEB|nr:acyltransferase [Microbispora sp. GKU 823]OPG03133.1 acyltransferase [Microbispora sp. GKU 823]
MAKPPLQGQSRLAGLDGIRGLAALFVVLHHCWLMSFPGFPSDNGPLWAGWLLYGHFAVVVFIVLSGFSLAVGPARHEWRLGGLARFGHRRTWRILPPYWAALVYSLIIAWTVVPQTDAGPPTAKSVLLYGLLIQDVFGAPSPNGAFWSIAIEAQLYVVFPLLLLVIRRFGAAVMACAVTALVTAVGALSPVVPAVALLDRFTPQFAALFAFGAVAAGVVGGHWRAPAPWTAAVAAVPVVALIAVQGSVWTVNHYFWVDLALGPAVGLFLAALAAGRPAPLVTFLDTRPVRSLGSFSYSLYLTHAPLVVTLHELVVAPHVPKGVPAFLTMIALAVPASLLVAWGFAAVFELPFQRHRSWGALRAAIGERLRPLRRRTSLPAPPYEPEKSATP